MIREDISGFAGGGETARDFASSPRRGGALCCLPFVRRAAGFRSKAERAVRRHVISCGCDWARRDAPGRGRSLRVFTQIPPPRQTAGRHPNTTCASLQGLPPPTCSLQLFVPATQRAGRLLHVVSCGCDWARRDALGRGRCTPKYHLSASHPRFPPPPTVSSSFRQQATLIHTTAYRGRAGARMPPSLALGEELPRRVTVTA